MHSKTISHDERIILQNTIFVCESKTIQLKLFQKSELRTFLPQQSNHSVKMCLVVTFALLFVPQSCKANVAK